MLTLIGSAKSRASRSLVVLEELGVRYQYNPLHPGRPEDRSQILALNANGRIPILVDGPFVLWESMAIGLYLAERYGKNPLWPATAEERGQAYQWSFWAQTEIDVVARHAARASRDPSVRQQANEERLARLKLLDSVLAKRPYLVGSALTIADLNLAVTLSEPGEKGLIDGEFEARTSGLSALDRWLSEITSRSSWARVAILA